MTNNVIQNKNTLFMRIKESFMLEPGVWYSRAAFLLGIPVSFAAVEIMNANSALADLRLWAAAWNIIWYFVLFLTLRLIVGRRRAAALIGSLSTFGFGVVNHYVLRFRGRSLFPTDIMSLRTAANVADAFDFTPDAEMYAAAALIAIYVILLLCVDRERSRSKLPRKAAVYFTTGVVTFYLVFFVSPLLPLVGLEAQQWDTNRNGFLFNFMVSLRYSFVSEPDGYSEDAVDDIIDAVMDELPDEPPEISVPDEIPEQDEPPEDEPLGGEVSDDLPISPANLIVIMNESLADLSIYENFEANIDPLEFYHSLEENTIKGYIYSPVTGGGTANVEYEYLTGNSTTFLPEGTTAYQLYMNSDTPSLASLAGALGYTTYAYHPYDASGWNRTEAYVHLGFEHQMYDTDTVEPEFLREYISDACDYKNIIRITEQSEDDMTFMFNVTMQNHSGYDVPWGNLMHTVTTDYEGEGKNAYEQYLSLVDASDEALRELIAYYSESEEPTMIVMFGDHQPPLPDEVYEYLYGKPLDERTDEEILREYKAPFFIWTNYDIEERSGVEMSISFLHSLTVETANLPMTGYALFNSVAASAMPVVHEIGVITSDGTLVSDPEELPDYQRTIYMSYDYLSYLNLFDMDEDVKSFFYLNE